MSELPADVDDYYRRMAEERRWTPATETAFRASVAWFRELDEGPKPRHHFAFTDDDEGARWLFEAVEVNDEMVAVKQIQVSPAGTAHHYWWQRMEDDAGFLTDQALADLPATTRAEFYAVWDRVVLPTPGPGSL